MTPRFLGFTRAFWAATVVAVLMGVPAFLLAPPEAAVLVALYIALGIGIIGTIDLRRGPQDPEKFT